jgi:hypothetical protein
MPRDLTMPMEVVEVVCLECSAHAEVSNTDRISSSFARAIAQRARNWWWVRWARGAGWLRWLQARASGAAVSCLSIVALYLSCTCSRAGAPKTYYSPERF